jgi:peptidoglycan/LPS O-acetylase OafA/YrhL
VNSRRRGHVDLGCTGAIVLVVVFGALAPKLGWERWPWWGKTLYGLGLLAVLFGGVALEQGRTWVKPIAPAPPPDESNRE